MAQMMTAFDVPPRRTDFHLHTGLQCRRVALILALLACALACLGPLAGGARADGPVSPTATNYLARITHAPSGLNAKIVDGYLSMSLTVAPSDHVTVMDFRGAPWVRFTPSGVAVNLNSEEYYLSQVPFPASPPNGLTRTTPPHWKQVSSGHSYTWREGRLHALATIAVAPGQSYMGPWLIPVVVNGRQEKITGGVWYHGAPSPVWFWPIVVMVACTFAGVRLRSTELNRRIARPLALAVLTAVAVGMGSKYLHGAPGIGLSGVLFLIITLAIVAAVARPLIAGRFEGLLLLCTCVISLWAGLTLLPTLTHGYAMVVIPILLIRVITVVLLGGALSLAVLGTRLLERAPDVEAEAQAA